jgi:hypothetical protein
MPRLVKIVAATLAVVQPLSAAGNALPSWNDGAAKKAIVGVIAHLAKEGSADWERLKLLGKSAIPSQQVPEGSAARN